MFLILSLLVIPNIPETRRALAKLLRYPKVSLECEAWNFEELTGHWAGMVVIVV